MTDPNAPGGSPDPRLNPDGSQREPAQPSFQGAPQPEPQAWNAPAGSEPVGAPPMADAPVPAAPAGPQPAGKRGILIVLLVLVLPLALIIWAVKDNVAADDLKVGDCFNVPSGTTVTTITHFPCTESHTAEVFHVTTYTESGTAYPLSINFDSFVDTACTPVFATYVGASLDARPDLSFGYFFPSRDGWGKGDRAITCYVGKADESAITTSLNGSGTP